MINPRADLLTIADGRHVARSKISCGPMTQRLLTALIVSGNKPRESCGKTCQGDRDDEWMGVSLARQDKGDGRILVSLGM